MCTTRRRDGQPCSATGRRPSSNSPSKPEPGNQRTAPSPGRLITVVGSAAPPAPDRSAELTSQGHPLTIFRRSIEVGNVVAAELAARETRGLGLADALDLTALVALRNRERSRRFSARWLQRYLDETPGVTIDGAVMVAGCLAALGGARHEKALAALRAMST